VRADAYVINISSILQHPDAKGLGISYSIDTHDASDHLEALLGMERFIEGVVNEYLGLLDPWNYVNTETSESKHFKQAMLDICKEYLPDSSHYDINITAKIIILDYQLYITITPDIHGDFLISTQYIEYMKWRNSDRYEQDR